MQQNEDGQIAEPQYRCPHTNLLLGAGILADPDTLKKTWNNTVNVHCPHCSMYHRFRVRDAFTEHALRL